MKTLQAFLSSLPGMTSLAQHIQTYGDRGSGHTNYLSSTMMVELKHNGQNITDEIIY